MSLYRLYLTFELCLAARNGGWRYDRRVPTADRRLFSLKTVSYKRPSTSPFDPQHATRPVFSVDATQWKVFKGSIIILILILLLIIAVAAGRSESDVLKKLKACHDFFFFSSSVLFFYTSVIEVFRWILLLLSSKACVLNSHLLLWKCIIGINWVFFFLKTCPCLFYGYLRGLNQRQHEWRHQQVSEAENINMWRWLPPCL